MVYVNGRFLTQKITGVNRFAYEMCNELFKMGFEFRVVVNKKHINDEYNIVNFKIIDWGFGISHFWEQLIFPFYFLFKRDFVVVNFSGLGSFFLRNQIVTIHDLSFLHKPEWFSKLYYYYYSFMTPLLASKSIKILTVSEFSKSQIHLKLNQPLDKITVIYNAVSESFYYNKNFSKIDEDYILLVSSHDPRKNIGNLVKAVELLPLNIKLYVIGDSNPVFNSTKFNNSISVRFLGRVSDLELQNYYKWAKLFVYPSLYEGFGLPPLEAVTMGCSTIVSDIEVFREVFEDAVGYFNPLNTQDIKKCIEKYYLSTDVINNDNVERIKSKYSWSKSANKFIDLIDKLKN